jgi:hypothetical protein
LNTSLVWLIDDVSNDETRKLAEPSWMLHRRRRLVHRVGRTRLQGCHKGFVPGFRHRHRIVEVATGFSQPAKIVDSQA